MPPSLSGFISGCSAVVCDTNSNSNSYSDTDTFPPFGVLFVLLLPLSDTPRIFNGSCGVPASVVLNRGAPNEWRNDHETRGKHLSMGIMWCSLFIYCY